MCSQKMGDQPKLGPTSFLETNKICCRTVFWYRRKSHISMGRSLNLNINQANISTFSPKLRTKRLSAETRLAFQLTISPTNMAHTYITALKRTRARIFASLVPATQSAHNAFERTAHVLPGTRIACLRYTVTCHKPTTASAMPTDPQRMTSFRYSMRLRSITEIGKAATGALQEP